MYRTEDRRLVQFVLGPSEHLFCGVDGGVHIDPPLDGSELYHVMGRVVDFLPSRGVFVGLEAVEAQVDTLSDFVFRTVDATVATCRHWIHPTPITGRSAACVASKLL